MMASRASRSAVTDTTAGKPAAITADVGQLRRISSMPREALKTRASETRRDRGAGLDAQRLGARDHFQRVGNIGRRDRFITSAAVAASAPRRR